MKKTQNNFGSCRNAKASFLNWISSEIWWKFESMPILSQSFCGSRSLDVLYHLSKPFETRIKRPWLMEGDWVIRRIPPCFGSILLYKYIHIWLIGWVHGSVLLENLGFDMAFDSCRKSRCIHPRFAPQTLALSDFNPPLRQVSHFSFQHGIAPSPSASWRNLRWRWPWWDLIKERPLGKTEIFHRSKLQDVFHQ